MKTFDDRKKSVQDHMTRIRKNSKKGIIAATSLCLVLALALVLFMPLDTGLPNMDRYRDTSYYDLIQKINQATYKSPQYHNRFEAFMDSFVSMASGKTEDKVMMENIPMNSGAHELMPDPDNATGEYVEVTDNQVEGVIESDIFKRSSEYIFYLRGGELFVYSIAQENSALVGSFRIPAGTEQEADRGLRYSSAMEMYLSQDCKTVTIVMQVYSKEMGTCTVLVSLDVTDPANITETNRVCMTGSYISSRMVDGQLLTMSRYYINRENVDFNDPETFVPQVGTGDNMELVAPENIASPDVLSHLTYTVISTVSEKTLEVKGTAAVLSYSDQMYVSEDTVYATRTFSHATEKDAGGCYTQSSKTEIIGIRYAGEKLEFVGAITLNGTVKDQYSMDQHNGVLRVVTSTFSTTYKEYVHGEIASVTVLDAFRSVDLYCVDLESWEIAASVIGFAPDGENAQSVRFDGDQAYVCTALVMTFTDPVFFFDLSDLSNITWTDTGVIDGYSTSLIQLGDGYLMGVGYGSDGMLKIEVYREMDGKVVSVCAYEAFVAFSEEYKSYYIDRENDLIGLPTVQDGGRSVYLLLHFDGYQLQELAKLSYSGSREEVRGTIIDGWLYLLSGDFAVQQIW